MDQYVYHRVPRNLRGTTLMPLSTLRVTFPDLYAIAVEKYRGREILMKQRIPSLNVLWNDVIHFAPIDPRKVYQSLVRSGCKPPEDVSWFRVPIEMLSAMPTTIFTYPEAQADDYRLYPVDFIPLDVSNYRELDALPEPTIIYFAASATVGVVPLTFHRVPHILLHGVIDVTDMDTVTWSADE